MDALFLVVSILFVVITKLLDSKAIQKTIKLKVMQLSSPQLIGNDQSYLSYYFRNKTCAIS